MDIQEFQNNQSERWCGRIRKSCIDVSIVILAIEIITFLIYFFSGSIDINLFYYICIRIILPSGINFGSIYMLRYILESKKCSTYIKNCCTLLCVVVVCGVVSIFHSYYFVIWMAPAIGLFYSTIFNDLKILKFISRVVIGEVLVTAYVEFKTQNFEIGTLITYLMVVLVISIFEYILAKEIVKYNIVQQDKIYNEFMNLQKMTEELKIEPMTLLYNRKALSNDIYEIYRQKLLNETRQYFLVMFDIDHFKMVNDVYGHLNGDEVLRRLAQILKEDIRSVGRIYRYGGEEFFAILESDDGQAVYNIIEGIRLKLKEQIFEFDQELRVTFSAGILRCEDTVSVDKWITDVDALLYEAKETGRDRIRKNF